MSVLRVDPEVLSKVFFIAKSNIRIDNYATFSSQSSTGRVVGRKACDLTPELNFGITVCMFYCFHIGCGIAQASETPIPGVRAFLECRTRLGSPSEERPNTKKANCSRIDTRSREKEVRVSLWEQRQEK